MIKNIIWLCTALLFLTACGSNQFNEEESAHEPGGEDNISMEAVQTSINQLGLKAVSQLEENEDGNRFVSPISIWLAMNMAYHGANGETKAEIEQALILEHIDANALGSANNSLLKEITKTEDDLELSLANSLWLNESFTLQPTYQEQMKEQYLAQIEPLTTAEAINNWIAEQTNDRIDQMIDQVDPSLALLLLNAVYFQGAWSYPFNEEWTEEQDFHLSDGDTVQAPFMLLHEDVSYLENEEVQAVALPYGEDESIQMHIFLPNEKSNFHDFQADFNLEKWQQWTKAMQIETGSISLPSFELEYETELNQWFQELGIEQAFDPDQADFSNMLELTEPTNAYINDILHKTFISVDEAGTEAAGTTSVSIDVTSAPLEDPFEMEVNRPFLFTITDMEQGVILFVGSMGNPGE